MNQKHLDFLIEFLGETGTKALLKASDCDDSLASILMPRAILSFVNSYSFYDSKDIYFKKSEDGCEGNVNKHFFENVDQLHVAASIGIGLGLEPESLDINKTKLYKLGKSLDLLVKVKQLNEIKSLSKSIKSVNQGNVIPEKTNFVHRVTPTGVKKTVETGYYDYNHVLPAEHRNNYSLQVKHVPKTGSIIGCLFNKGNKKTAVGFLDGNLKNGTLTINDTEIQPGHRGKGLGTPLYESVMAFAHHNGANEVAGDIHSTMASNVHKKLSEKHGMDYKPEPTPYPELASPEPGPNDDKFGPYKYTIKKEMPETKKFESPGDLHAPKEPIEHIEPVAPTKQKERGPKYFKIKKSDSNKKCSVCKKNFIIEDVFTGCTCLKALNKSIKTEKTIFGYTIKIEDEELSEVFLDIWS